MLAVALLLNGCGETLNEYYISNHSDADVTVRLTPLYIETIELASGPLVATLDRSVRASLPHSVSYEQEQETLQFTLPAQTTVYLGSSTGGTELFSQLEVLLPDDRLTMDGHSFEEHFEVHDRGVGAIVYVLNIQ